MPWDDSRVGSPRHTSPGYGVRHQITTKRVASGSHARSHQRLLPSTAPSRASTDHQRAASSSSRRAARRAGRAAPTLARLAPPLWISVKSSTQRVSRWLRAPARARSGQRIRRCGAADGLASWAVPGPSEAARQWPMTTNDDHQAHEPTAPEQQNPARQDSRKDPGQEEAENVTMPPTCANGADGRYFHGPGPLWALRRRILGPERASGSFAVARPQAVADGGASSPPRRRCSRTIRC